MKIAFFGSSLVSAFWNGAATYYRGVLRALADRGHQISFFEPDAFDRQKHRDIDDPEWAQVVVYPASDDGVARALEQARGADLLVKASGVGVYDSWLEREVLSLQSRSTLVAFWDVDAPATLDRMRGNAEDEFRELVDRYDLIFTYGGGTPVVKAYQSFGARLCVPIYNGFDPRTHHPVAPDERFTGTLGFLGNRLPDREARVEEFFLRPAAASPDEHFVLGGNGWQDKSVPANVRHLGHVYTRDHNAFNCTPRAVLNVSRDSMAAYGYSPATRVFEAAGAGACMITDAWEGIEQFFEPGSEILVAHDGAEVQEHLRELTAWQAREIGNRALRRARAQHTYADRAGDVDQVLASAAPRPRKSSSGRAQLDIVMLGLSLTSSWGNGHATTYRGLMRELCKAGHRVTFLERDLPWYADNRDLPQPPYGTTHLYDSLEQLQSSYGDLVRDADLVMVGSYVPDGVAVGDWVLERAHGTTAFYDIDTPVTLAKLQAQDCEYLHPRQIARYDMYLSFTGGPTLRYIERELNSPRALPLYCSVDPDMYRAEDSAPGWDLSYMGTYSEDRQPTLERLLLEPARAWPDGRFVVAGPQYPDEIAWPDNCERLQHIPPAEHGSFYSSSRFTLNVTRASMVRAGYSPSVRLFEAAACGTPIISDGWSGLDSFLRPGEEILVAQTASEALDIVQNLPEARRVALGQRARQRVMAEHTAAHRAETLEQYVVEERSLRRAARSA